MELIFNNQCSIFKDILYKYLTPKQCIKLYSSNKRLYKIYLKNKKFKYYYYIPKNKKRLQKAVDEWCDNKEKAILKYGHISYWNIINIIDMSSLFYRKRDFNDDISDWNISNVYNLNYIFEGALKFDKLINKWDTSSVIHMYSIFTYPEQYIKLTCNNWNLSKLNADSRRLMDRFITNNYYSDSSDY